MKKLSIVLGTLIFSTTVIGLAKTSKPAMKNYDPSIVTSAIAGNHAYLGIQGGYGTMDVHISEVGKAIFDAEKVSYEAHEPKATAGRIFAGYLWLAGEKGHLGAEIGYGKHPNRTYTFSFEDEESLEPEMITTEVKFKGYYLDLLGVAKYNFTPQINAFVKGGIAYVHQTVTIEGDTTFFSLFFGDIDIEKATLNKFLPEAAIGVGYDINRNFSVDLSYSHIFGEAINLPMPIFGAASVNTLMLGVTAHFN